MNLIIYGPEGSGKGTQAKLLADKLNLRLITSGDLVRDAAKNNTGEPGDACRKSLSEGVYVPDPVMFTLWENRLKEIPLDRGFILDGFPRNREQAEFLMRIISGRNSKIDHFIYLHISDEVAKDRLLKRNRKLFEGSDELHDSPERIEARLKVYHANEQRLLEFFRNKGVMLEVNGESTVEVVFGRIIRALGISGS